MGNTGLAGDRVAQRHGPSRAKVTLGGLSLAAETRKASM